MKPAHPPSRGAPPMANALPMQTRLAPVASIEAETRTVEVVWTTGASVRRRRWTGFDTAIDYEEILVVSRDAVDLSRLDAIRTVRQFDDVFTAPRDQRTQDYITGRFG